MYSIRISCMDYSMAMLFKGFDKNVQKCTYFCQIDQRWRNYAKKIPELINYVFYENIQYTTYTKKLVKSQKEASLEAKILTNIKYRIFSNLGHALY